MSYVDRVLMMTDIVGYSKMSQQDQARSIEVLLNSWFRSDLPNSTKLGGCALLPTGDGFIGVLPLASDGGVPVWLLDSIISTMERASQARPSFQLRFGLHRGPCRPVQITGTSFDFEADPNNFLGYNMNYVARLVSCAGAGQIIASTEFVRSLEPTLAEHSRFQIWRDAFVASFKGDLVRYPLAGVPEVVPSMGAAQEVAQDEREVHSLVLLLKGQLYGSVPVPRNSVHYTGENNYHGMGAVHRTNFQRLSDSELFHLYREESRIATVMEQPFFLRLPFAVLYAAGDDGPLRIVAQTEIEDAWQIDDSWIEEFFGEIDNGHLCSLSRCEIDANSGKALLSYMHCRYSQSLATVISPDRCVRGKLGDSLRYQLLGRGKARLPSLGGSLFTGHIGVTAIVLTSDGLPIIQPRTSKGLHSNINSQSASASGAVEWTDWLDYKRPLVVELDKKMTFEMNYEQLIDLFRPEGSGGELMPSDRAIIRETAEEIGFLPDAITSIQLIGIAREFRRVGKPEFFYLIRSSLPSKEAAKQARNFATYKWEYGGKLKEATNPGYLPPTKEQQRFYLATHLSDPCYNEITRLAFYFLLRSVSGIHGKQL